MFLTALAEYTQLINANMFAWNVLLTTRIVLHCTTWVYKYLSWVCIGYTPTDVKQICELGCNYKLWKYEDEIAFIVMLHVYDVFTGYVPYRCMNVW